MIFKDLKGGRFYNEDCFDAMRDIPDGVIDMIWTDPPYRVISGGTKSELGVRWNNSVLSKNDGKIFNHNDVNILDYMIEFFRILKEGSHCYVMTNNINLKELLICGEKAGFGFHNLLIWRKNNCTAK